ncbi:WS/DGAT/MGAT family O-acyltransferase [Mycolicibacterium sp. Dal123E01]|uniref:WS/DGAT/MGAT family O-acyltransferase n=1 Tax=Mycolicibacterium sp. Dal123E01 TaxID=3457578 RepID=UPI00403ED0A5
MTIHRLSGFDASLLHLESEEQPMTGCALWELDTSTMPGGYSFEKFRDTMSGRLRAIPEFRMKLADSVLNLDTPVWVDDPDFDIDDHLHRVELPAPGTSRELSELLGRLHAERIDLSGPPWGMWVIEGLSGDDPRFSGSIAVMHRMHHILADGVVALAILSRLCSTEADAAPLEPIAGVGTVSDREIVLDGLRRFMRRPWYLIMVLRASVFGAIETLRRSGRGQTMAGLFSAPRAPFNGRLTPRRSVSFVQLDLNDVKTVKDKFGVTVNDVLLALVAGALRRFLLERAALPEVPLVAAIPVSVFEANRASRNQLSAMLSSLCTDIDDAVGRLKAIAAASSLAKDHVSAVGPTLGLDWTQFAPGILSLGWRLYSWSGLSERRPIYNLTLSNVPGPQEQFYLMGSAVRARYAFGPVFHGAGLNITVMSLNGRLDVGITSCSDLLPDPWDLADDLTLMLKELMDAGD